MFSFPPSAALAAGERGNTGSLPRCVHRVGGVVFLAGGALEVVASPVRIRLPPLLPLSVVVLWFAGVERVAFCAPRSVDLGCGWSLRAVGEATVLIARRGDLVLPPCRRRIVVVPDGDAGQVRWCAGDLEGGRVISRPAQVKRLVVDGSVGSAPVWWCWRSVLRPGVIWRSSFIGLSSVAARRTTLVLEAWSSSPVVVRGCCGFVFSGDGGGIAGVLGRVLPRCVSVLLFVSCSVLCFI